MLRLVLAALLMLALTTRLAAAQPADSTAAAPVETVRYQLGLLMRGPGYTPEHSARVDSIQAGHMANIGRMAQLGALVAAGPILNGGELRGVFVFAPEATGLDTLLAADPAIASQRLECRLFPWIAPPGLGDDYRKRTEALDRTVAGEPDSMVTFGWVMLRRGSKYDSKPTPEVEKLLAKHGEYMRNLRASGQLVYAGDIEGTGELRGVLIMQGDSAHVARAVLADPAVKGKRYVAQVLRWFTAWGTVPGH